MGGEFDVLFYVSAALGVTFIVGGVTVATIGERMWD